MKRMYSAVTQYSKGRTISLGLLSLCLALVFLFYLGGERDFRKGVSIGRAFSYMEGVRIVGRKNGADSWFITAGKAVFSKDESTALIDSVAISMPDAGVTLNANKGSYNLLTNDLRLDENLTIRTKDSTVYLKSLAWNPSSGTLTSDNSIRITGGRFSIEGDRFTANENQKIKLMKNVKATFF